MVISQSDVEWIERISKMKIVRNEDTVIELLLPPRATTFQGLSALLKVTQERMVVGHKLQQIDGRLFVHLKLAP